MSALQPDMTPGDLVPAGSAADLAEGEIRQVLLPCGRPVALYRVEGAVYATDDTCSHGQASLSDEGMLEGTKIICGWHLGAFDVTTGEALDQPCWEPIRTYGVVERDGELFLESGAAV
ncbi:bifunctional 3-phenylpropionate/cinnamic acid dioxygenase ferredoxin subunit [soil metagenome]